MARPLLNPPPPGASQPTHAGTLAPPSPPQRQPQASSPAPAAADAPSVLAGLLPGWDLLPASPFVRRSK